MEMVNDPDCGYIKHIPLILAAKKDYLDIVKLLLKVPNIDVNQKDVYGCTALHNASSEGYSEVMKQLLAVEGIDVNAASKYGSTPLHLASRQFLFNMFNN
ncbi:hypothetical protein TNCT_78431 [Trichonephila clavata]|uniref:Alpha-latrotoxin n=1 Tax=Trichonephila clavata TaxID=2740835 RepID=A0A8X6F4E1_TRICU|nr:hypothetical protein TNCT_78431 [Trichonephila clavata]